MVVPAHQDLGKCWQVSDIATTRSIAKLKVWVFDTEAVGCAATDLLVIQDRLGEGVVGQGLFSQQINLSPPTWRYKPSMLELVPHGKVKTPPTQ